MEKHKQTGDEYKVSQQGLLTLLHPQADLAALWIRKFIVGVGVKQCEVGENEEVEDEPESDVRNEFCLLKVHSFSGAYSTRG